MIGARSMTRWQDDKVRSRRPSCHRSRNRSAQTERFVCPNGAYQKRSHTPINSSHPERFHCRRSGQESGSALLEFAFALMVLLTLTFGMIDLSRAVYANNVVQAAAQAGARAGLVNMANAEPVARSRLAGLRPDRAQVTATLNNDQVQVVVTYRFEFITPFLSQWGDGVLNLSASASMRSY